MSSDAIQGAVLSTGHSGILDQEAVPHRFFVYAACTVLAATLNFALGKDMAWDALHYHFYAGFSALNDRFNQDYFAAGAQSYFNPYVYVPFYVLAKSGLPALAVSSILALIHSVVLWITYELACDVYPSGDSKGRFLFGLFAHRPRAHEPHSSPTNWLELCGHHDR